jgi:tRNA pseudouridine55 synthase
MDGILLVDKPQRLTSHDVVDIVRSKFGLKKCGHAGTLDPMATGLLVILAGSYTKRSDEFMKGDKSYDATLTLGATSDTGDAWGDVTGSARIPEMSDADIRRAFARFTGELKQAVPAYSAKKVDGKKMYELARKGVRVEAEPKSIVIHSLEITRIRLPDVSFSVKCSKGTYIRQLCCDIGSALGCGAYLSALRRTASGGFHIKDALDMQQMHRMSRLELERKLITTVAGPIGRATVVDNHEKRFGCHDRRIRRRASRAQRRHKKGRRNLAREAPQERGGHFQSASGQNAWRAPFRAEPHIAETPRIDNKVARHRRGRRHKVRYVRRARVGA